MIKFLKAQAVLILGILVMIGMIPFLSAFGIFTTILLWVFLFLIWLAIFGNADALNKAVVDSKQKHPEGFSVWFNRVFLVVALILANHPLTAVALVITIIALKVKADQALKEVDAEEEKLTEAGDVRKILKEVDDED